jgi:hypothetical protein
MLDDDHQRLYTRSALHFSHYVVTRQPTLLYQVDITPEDPIIQLIAYHDVNLIQHDSASRCSRSHQCQFE